MNRKIYRQVAKKHGVTVSHVKREIQSAIDEVYKTPNDCALEVDCEGEKPTT